MPSPPRTDPVSAMKRMPALFVPHGAPTFALDDGPAAAALAAIMTRVERPKAILVVTPHWDTTSPQLGGALRPETIHDFSGFPRELHALRYPAPGAYCTAMTARDLLQDSGIAAGVDLERGLDHGVWVPLRHMLPQADVPVVPLSIQSRLGPAHHFRVGRALAPLLDDGVLIVASGNLTHNLRDFGRYTGRPGEDPAYVREFADWMWQHIEAGGPADLDALLAYRSLAPGAVAAHPADDHLLPLYVALGAASGDGETGRRERFFTGTVDKVLAMDAFAWWPADA